jgi:hypothetical protein
MKKTPDFDAAAAFLAGHARVLDRRVFQRLFRGGPATPVRDAVAAYRNDDGGFGQALEPDCRAGASQPAAVEMALRVMDLADAWDDGLVRGAVDWLVTVAPAEGGATFVEPSVNEAPGEVHTPLDFAPLPDSIGRPLFDEAVISAHLDHLAAAQRDDGGWTFGWPSWSLAAEAD